MDCLTLDIGGTKTAAAWWVDGVLSMQREAPTPRDVQGLAALLEHWASSAPSVQQIGAAITGTTDGRVVRALNSDLIEGWDGFVLADQLERIFNTPAVLLNDAQAAAWGEFRAREGTIDDLLFVTVSTGLGAGLVLGGRLRTGQSGLAGHLGHTLGYPLTYTGSRACTCGRGHCLERQVSGSALEEAMSAHGLGTRSARAWLEVAEREAPAVLSWLTRSGERLAQAIGDAHALLDLQRVVIGGGLGLHPRFLASVQAGMKSLPMRFQVPIESARLGSGAGLQGMEHWIRKQMDTETPSNLR